MNLSKITLATFAALTLVQATDAVAANKKYLNQQTALNNMMQSNSASILSTSPKDLIGLSVRNELVVLKEFISNNGEVTRRYQQTYQGLPVIGDTLSLTFKNGMLKKAHGAAVYDIEGDINDVSAKLSVKQAMLQSQNVGIAAKAKGLKKHNEKSRLAIWVDQQSKAHLVYEVSYVTYGKSPSRPYQIIDANTGEVLLSYDNLQHADATGPGGNLKTGKYIYGTDFSNLDVSQSGNTCVMDNANVCVSNRCYGHNNV